MAAVVVPASELTDLPYAAVAFIHTTFPDGTKSYGTGALVGSNDVLTAAHNLYNASRGGWVIEIALSFGLKFQADGFTPDFRHLYLPSDAFSWRVKAWSLPPGTQLTQSQSQLDVALIALNRNVADMVGGYLGLAAGRDHTQTVLSLGYPWWGGGLIADEVTVSRPSSPSVYIASSGAEGAANGASGGPLLTEDNYVIGLLSTGDDARDQAVWADIGHVYDQLVGFRAENDADVISFQLIAENSIVYEGNPIAVHVVPSQPLNNGFPIQYMVGGATQVEDIVSGGTPFGLKTMYWYPPGQNRLIVSTNRDDIVEGDETVTLTLLEDRSQSVTVTIRDTPMSPGPSDAGTAYVFKSIKPAAAAPQPSYSYFYTTSTAEAEHVRSRADWPWVEQQATFEAAHSHLQYSKAVARFWSPTQQSHFFTAKTSEKLEVIQRSSDPSTGYDWVYEGDGFPVYESNLVLQDSAGLGFLPVYRLWISDKDFNPANGSAGGHYYTANYAEYEQMAKLNGVLGEGIAFYGEHLG